VRSGLGRWITAAVLGTALLVALVQAWRAVSNPNSGLDFNQLRHAGNALLHGTNIYRGPLHNLLPPTAAVVLVPLAYGSYSMALDTWLVLCTIAVAAAGVLSMMPWRRGKWIPLAGVAALLLLKSDVMAESLLLGNISLLLPPVAVGVLLLFEADGGASAADCCSCLCSSSRC
jgi:hypothetical protein